MERGQPFVSRGSDSWALDCKRSSAVGRLCIERSVSLHVWDVLLHAVQGLAEKGEGQQQQHFAAEPSVGFKSAFSVYPSL